MSTERQRPLRNVMIPWVITLLALFGWNALALEYGRIRKGEAPGEIGLSQVSDESEMTGRTADPDVFLPVLCEAVRIEPDPIWWWIPIPKESPLPFAGVPEGRNRGRAPPWIDAPWGV